MSKKKITFTLSYSGFGILHKSYENPHVENDRDFINESLTALANDFRTTDGSYSIRFEVPYPNDTVTLTDAYSNNLKGEAWVHSFISKIDIT